MLIQLKHYSFFILNYFEIVRMISSRKFMLKLVKCINILSNLNDLNNEFILNKKHF
jgi:hypothetical protein